MSQIRTQTSNGRIYPSHSRPGERAELKIINDTSQRIPAEEIEITIDSPDHVYVQPERVKELEGVYVPHNDLEEGDSLIIPMFIRSEPWTSDISGDVLIEVRFDGFREENALQLLV